LEDEVRSRREFLAGASSIGVAWLIANWPGIAAARAHAAAMAATTGSSAVEYFTLDEARAVEAITAQIVPTDDTPGAREAGAMYFIDRSLTSWASATADLFRAGLREFRVAFAAGHPSLEFAAAHSATQIAFLVEVESTEFFKTVRTLTLLGMFSLPSYGGNRGAVGWKLLGFEDAHAFIPPFGYYDRDYPGFGVAKEGA
jgi:gluconate 2-dehydrogenase gamma chain